MNIKKFFFSATLALGIYTSQALAAPGSPYSDEWIEGRIGGAYAYNSALDSTDISVESSEGTVTLTGKVPSDIEKDFAERIALATEGVKKVENNLVVDESMVGTARSGFGQRLRDATITASVKSKLLANRDTHGMSIDVDTTGNVVTLNGKARSQEEKSLAQQLALNTSGVRDVRNNLIIEEKAQSEVQKDLKSAANTVTDAWISTKVRTLLTFSNDFPGSEVNVSTTQGKVTLNGYARSPNQKKLIEDAVREVNGVIEIDNRLSIAAKAS